MEVKQNNRGFSYAGFTDLYGHEVSIQDSSLATDYAIWLGLDEPYTKINKNGNGPFGPYEDYTLPDNILVWTRMHINREQAQDLIEVLQRFVDTGSIRG